MSRIAYVNGLYTPLAQARVHIEDRGYQFADGVYEVIAVIGGEANPGAPPVPALTDQSASRQGSGQRPGPGQPMPQPEGLAA